MNFYFKIKLPRQKLDWLNVLVRSFSTKLPSMQTGWITDTQTSCWRQTTFSETNPPTSHRVSAVITLPLVFTTCLTFFFIVVFSGSPSAILARTVKHGRQTPWTGSQSRPCADRLNGTHAPHSFIPTWNTCLRSKNTQRKGRASDQTWPEWRKRKKKQDPSYLLQLRLSSYWAPARQEKTFFRGDIF